MIVDLDKLSLLASDLEHEGGDDEAAMIRAAVAEIRAARAAAGRPAAPAWAREKPTAPGWYWVRGGGDRPRVLEVERYPRAGWLGVYGVPLPDSWQWSGPIPLPPGGEAKAEGE